MKTSVSITSRIVTVSVLCFGLIAYPQLSLSSTPPTRAAASSMFASTQATAFGFGPGTARPNSSNASALLTVPARTTVRVSGVLNPISSILPVSVVVEVFRPEGGSAAARINTAAAPAVSVPFAFLAEIFSSQRGCPDSWRVRVRTANNAVPPVGISGSVTFDFQRPGVVNVDMVGDPLSLATNGSTTRNLAGHDVIGIANSSLIAGTGTFRIKAKWDTDPVDVAHFNQFFQVTVDLLRPDGSRAAGMIGFSQHGSFTPKVDFSYTVTPQEALMTGSWKVRVRNNAPTGGVLVKIVSFDLENLVFPTFNSTFQAACSN